LGSVKSPEKTRLSSFPEAEGMKGGEVKENYFIVEAEDRCEPH
jgi:hypothetical protein